MKLYIWEDVLHDYWPGMIVAIAPDLRSAKDAVRKAYGSGPVLENDLKKVKPTVVDLSKNPKPKAWYVSGGG